MVFTNKDNFGKPQPGKLDSIPGEESDRSSVEPLPLEEQVVDTAAERLGAQADSLIKKKAKLEPLTLDPDSELLTGQQIYSFIKAEIARTNGTRRSFRDQFEAARLKKFFKKLQAEPKGGNDAFFRKTERTEKRLVGSIMSLAGLADPKGQSADFFRAIGADPRFHGPEELNYWLVANALDSPHSLLSEGIITNLEVWTPQSLAVVWAESTNPNCSWRQENIGEIFRNFISDLDHQSFVYVEQLQSELLARPKTEDSYF